MPNVRLGGVREREGVTLFFIALAEKLSSRVVGDVKSGMVMWF